MTASASPTTTNDNPRHTPLPWVANDAGLIFGQIADHEHEAPFVADTIGDRDRQAFGILTDAECANTALIVAACNAHHALIAALCRLMDAGAALDAALDGTTDQFEAEIADLQGAMKSAYAALMLAKGGAA